MLQFIFMSALIQNLLIQIKIMILMQLSIILFSNLPMNIKIDWYIHKKEFSFELKHEYIPEVEAGAFCQRPWRNFIIPIGGRVTMSQIEIYASAMCIQVHLRYVYMQLKIRIPDNSLVKEFQSFLKLLTLIKYTWKCR